METLSSSRTNLYKVLFLIIGIATFILWILILYIIWFEYRTTFVKILFSIPALSFIAIPILAIKVFIRLVVVQYENGYMFLKNWGSIRKESLEDLQCEGHFRLAIIDVYRRWTFSKLKAKKDNKEYLVLNKSFPKSLVKFNQVFYDLKFRRLKKD